MNGTNRPDGVREMVKMALLMAMNCVSAYVIIPLPFSLSPISLQTVFVNLLGFLLTPRQVLITMCAYLLMGLAGLPVFTGGTAGPRHGRAGQTVWAYRRIYFRLFSGSTYHQLAARQ